MSFSYNPTTSPPDYKKLYHDTKNKVKIFMEHVEQQLNAMLAQHQKQQQQLITQNKQLQQHNSELQAELSQMKNSGVRGSKVVPFTPKRLNSESKVSVGSVSKEEVQLCLSKLAKKITLTQQRAETEISFN